MLTALRLGNFKAFGKTQRIPLKPLTLVFGPNSAGKSSIIHSLALAHEAWRSGNLDTFGTDLGGTSIDLGGFRQYVFGRDPSHRVEWAVELDFDAVSEQTPFMVGRFRSAVVSANFGLPIDDVGKAPNDAATELTDYTIEVDGCEVVRMSRHEDGKLRIILLKSDEQVFQGLHDRIVRQFVASRELRDDIDSVDPQLVEKHIAALLPRLTVIMGHFLPTGIDFDFRREETRTTEISGGDSDREIGSTTLAAVVEFNVWHSLGRFLSWAASAVEEELGRLEYLGPLRSYPPRDLPLSEHDDVNWRAGGGYAWDVLRRDGAVRDRVNEWLAAGWLKTHYQLVLRELVAIDDVDKAISTALEDFEGSDHILDIKFDDNDPGHDGLEARPLISDSGEAISRVRTAIETSNIEKVPKLVLIDQRADTTVSHRDVGIGISQVLPVLVSCYGSRNRIVAIEQPEIHLHPALQAELGDVFIRAALGEQQNHFILETHSEHLMLRILRRIRETFDESSEAGSVSIRASDVCVLYVEPTPEGAEIREIPISSDGEFEQRWPDGFFSERLKELF